ncbi:hypothetical protein NC651_034098 [Populus alba x Populus x berolinensis]|nr:hypothetical protein NC651_034098 [Populus alba x Populus x berolinensis]
MNSEAFLGLVHKLDFSLHAQAACKPSLQAGEGVEHVCRRVGGKGAEGEVVIAILRSRRMEMHAKMKTTEGELGGEDFTRGVARERDEVPYDPYWLATDQNPVLWRAIHFWSRKQPKGCHSSMFFEETTPSSCRHMVPFKGGTRRETEVIS